MLHDVRVSFGGRRRVGDRDPVPLHDWTAVTRVKRYEVDSDMLEPEDAFMFELPFTPDLYERAVPDNSVKMTIDGVTVLVGFIDTVERSLSRGGSVLHVRGRDKGGRLVDESAPLKVYKGLGIQQLAEAMTSPWFAKVELSNAKNRKLLRGRAKRSAKVSREPAIISTPRHAKKVNPGESRWDVLKEFLQEAQLLAWSSADGTHFVVGLPNHEQEPQFFFTLPSSTDRVRDSHVKSFKYTESVADMYAKIVCVGESKGDGVRYHSNVTKRFGVALEGPNANGTGAKFFFPKKLIVQDSDVQNSGEAKRRAQRDMEERRSTNFELELTATGHGQNGALFAFDNVAKVDDVEGFGRSEFLVTGVRFTGDKTAGQTTRILMVPTGTVLQVGG